MSKVIGLIAGLGLGIAVVAPSFVGAQSSGTGLLSVYVQVANPSSTSYQYVTPRNAGDFNVIVAGQSVSPSQFWGSLTGTQVSLGNGAYSVAVTGNQYGYSATYSQGCNGTIAAGQTALCIITMSPQYNSYYPSVYPYPNYTVPGVTCAPQHQTVGLNQTARFEAIGGIGGTYNWKTPFDNYPNVGRVLSTSFNSSGSHLVTVTNGAQSATCEVTVTNTYYPTPVSNPNYTTGYTYPNYIYPYGYAGGCTVNCGTPVVTQTYYPRLPNTGVEPLTVVQLALALTLVAGVALLTRRHVGKAFAYISR